MIKGLWLDIIDDWDLSVIADSGQCFRMVELPKEKALLFPGAPKVLYRVITRDHVLYIGAEDGRVWLSCDEEEWEKIWFRYFDGSMDYEVFRSRGGGENPFMREAFICGRGLRILRQDPFEMLLTFLLSQRKSIPAIAKNVEELCSSFGKKIKTPVEEVYAFPEPEALLPLSEEDYRGMGMGYRAPYLVDAVRKVCSEELDLNDIATLPTPELIEELQMVKGVGIKVASCVALFAYGRKDCAPVDVWIARAIREECDGCDPFPAFAPYQGLAQQYVFYYQKHRGKKVK